MHKLEPGDRVYHRRRQESGTYRGLDEADPSGATVWVEFDSGDELMVSRHLLSKETR
jgi:hypothetical protein